MHRGGICLPVGAVRCGSGVVVVWVVTDLFGAIVSTVVVAGAVF